MKQILLIVFVLCTTTFAQGQKFINNGIIEFEVKTNWHKFLGSRWDDDDDSWIKQIIASQPQFTVNYYKYKFNDNKSTYQFDRNVDTKKVLSWFNNINEDDLWYNDYESRKFVNKKAIDDNYIISGNLKNIQWKMYPNDNTIIAGFNCRRASTILYDSVYVFAYYTDEITISGGPMSLNGLPGMILGVTIPRLYTSWIATSVSLGEQSIKEPTKGKMKNEAELLQILTEYGKSRAKEYKNATKWISPMIWQTFL